MKVIKNNARDYDCYWNENEQKWEGLLKATTYHDNDNLPEVENGKVLDWNDVVGLTPAS